MAKVFLDKIKSTAHIESVVASEDLENGQFLTLGVLGDDGESRVATKAADEASAEVFVADAPLSYGDPHFDLGTYKIKAGETGRAFHLEKGDVLSVTTDLVSGAKVGDNLTIGKDGLGFAKAAEGKGIAMLIGQEAHGIDGDVYVIAIR